MASTAIATTPASTRTERYLEAERRLWQHYGLEPHERFIDLDAPTARLRVLEVGSGEPVLFVHGTVGPGAWASLISELSGFRAIVLERPGWGLSSAIDFSGQDYGKLVAKVLRGAFDALELEWAHVVGGSIGNVWALRLAQRHPAKVSRIVLMGGGPIVSEVGVPGIITPEVFFGAECYGPQASATAKRLLPEGARVRLLTERATDRVDGFGRLLRYVVRLDGVNVNLRLVALGAAAPYFYEGVRGAHANRLERLAKRARPTRLGLWRACPRTRYDPYRGIETRR
jgi:pimeloyl-ACP methyl ester carboxylesterase